MSGFGNSKAAAVSIRPARTDEQKMLESLQRRASLSNPGDRAWGIGCPGEDLSRRLSLAAGFFSRRYRDLGEHAERTVLVRSQSGV